MPPGGPCGALYHLRWANQTTRRGAERLFPSSFVGGGGLFYSFTPPPHTDLSSGAEHRLNTDGGLAMDKGESYCRFLAAPSLRGRCVYHPHSIAILRVVPSPHSFFTVFSLLWLNSSLDCNSRSGSIVIIGSSCFWIRWNYTLLVYCIGCLFYYGMV
jgi:hypothetical protein